MTQGEAYWSERGINLGDLLKWVPPDRLPCVDWLSVGRAAVGTKGEPIIRAGRAVYRQYNPGEDDFDGWVPVNTQGQMF